MDSGVSPMTPVERVEYEQAVSNLRAQTDEAAFSLAWGEGRAMTLEQAIAYAVGDSETPHTP